MGIFSQANKEEEKKLPFGKKTSKGDFGKKKATINKKSSTSQTKRRKKMQDIDMLDTSITVRLPDEEVKKRVLWIKDRFGYCQICGATQNLDYPHHALDGVSRKDDRTMIDICYPCHSTIHTKGFQDLEKTEEETVAISWDNNKEYLRSKE